MTYLFASSIRSRVWRDDGWRTLYAYSKCAPPVVSIMQCVASDSRPWRQTDRRSSLGHVAWIRLESLSPAFHAASPSDAVGRRRRYRHHRQQWQQQQPSSAVVTRCGCALNGDITHRRRRRRRRWLSIRDISLHLTSQLWPNERWPIYYYCYCCCCCWLPIDCRPAASALQLLLRKYRYILPTFNKLHWLIHNNADGMQVCHASFGIKFDKVYNTITNTTTPFHGGHEALLSACRWQLTLFLSLRNFGCKDAKNTADINNAKKSF